MKEKETKRRSNLKESTMDETDRKKMLQLVEEARQAVKPKVLAERRAEELPEAVAFLRFK